MRKSDYTNTYTEMPGKLAWKIEVVKLIGQSNTNNNLPCESN